MAVECRRRRDFLFSGACFVTSEPEEGSLGRMFMIASPKPTQDLTLQRAGRDTGVTIGPADVEPWTRFSRTPRALGRPGRTIVLRSPGERMRP